MGSEMSSAQPATRFALRPRALIRNEAEVKARSRVGWLEYLTMMFVISVYTGAITPALRQLSGGGALPPGDSDIGSTITQVFALFVVSIWALINLPRLGVIMRAIAPYMVIVVLCFISISWSGFPYNSLRRSITLTVCIFYGVYLCDRLGLDGMIRLFTQTAMILALVSVVVYVAMPTLGRDTAQGYENALRGVFAAKNTAGMAMLLAISCIIYLGSLPGASRLQAIAFLLLALATLVMTKSASSFLIAMIVSGLGCRLWLRSAQTRLLWNSAVIAVLLVVVFTVLFWPDQVFPALGRDSSLTGRVPLWRESMLLVLKRPLLGYGYSGFWNVDSHDVQYLWRVIDWPAPNAHDGYIDILLQIGFVGLVFYAFLWGVIVVKAIHYIRLGTLKQATWILLFMTVNILLNIDEGPLPYPDQFTLFVAASLLVLSNAKTAHLQTRRAGVSSRPTLPVMRARISGASSRQDQS